MKRLLAPTLIALALLSTPAFAQTSGSGETAQQERQHNHRVNHRENHRKEHRKNHRAAQ